MTKITIPTEFKVLVLCREDLERYLGDKAFKVNDEDMEYIAEKLGGALMDCGYWECLKTIIDSMFCYSCKEKQDSDGRCKCTNKDSN